MKSSDKGDNDTASRNIVTDRWVEWTIILEYSYFRIKVLKKKVLIHIMT